MVSVPLPPTSSQLLMSSETEPPYVVQLVDGSIVHIPPTIMDDIVDCHLHSSPTLSLSTWLGCKKKVMFLQAGEYMKGYMQFDALQKMWCFSQQQRKGEETWGVNLPDFIHSFQGYIDDGPIIPGWHSSTKFVQGLAHHVSAIECKVSCPGSLWHAMQPCHPDHSIWLDLYKEEYKGLTDVSSLDVITSDEYHTIRTSTGKFAIPSMGILSVKKDAAGHPD